MALATGFECDDERDWTHLLADENRVSGFKGEMGDIRTTCKCESKVE